MSNSSIIPHPKSRATSEARSECSHGFEEEVLNAPPSAGSIGMASLLGLCSGVATKKFAKTAGLTLGISFIGLQALAHAKIIEVNWARVEELFIGHLDLNSDGKIDHQDFKIACCKMINNLTTDLPSSAGFTVSFLAGVRYG